LKPKRKPNGYWTKERCAVEAARFSHRQDFADGSASAYVIAKRNGWMDDICQHMTPKANKRIRDVYEIADHRAKVVYVGLTYDVSAREMAHKRSERMRSAFTNGIRVHVLRRGLTEAEAQEAEAFFIEMYRFLGYRLINKHKAGSLGGTARKYTIESCRYEASRYSTRKAFREAAPYAYAMSQRRGWLPDICAHMVRLKRPNGYWTEARILAAARRFPHFTAFSQGGGSAYQAAVRSKLQNRIRSIIGERRKPRGFWSLENILMTASNYKSISEFKEAEPSAYATASYRSWLPDLRAKFEETSHV
jgi:predicted GIY-YIG superfamily endonuclease